MNKKPRGKICRRAGFSLWGEDTKYARLVQKRPYSPGDHGKKRKKRTLYGELLFEKQKMRHTYNISEKQFKNLVIEAKKVLGNSGDMLVQMCETRMDNLVWKMGFTRTIFQARQAIVHRHFTLNGKCHNMPSTQLKAGDKVALYKGAEFLKDQVKEAGYRKKFPSYVEVDAEAGVGVLTRIPEVDEIPKNALPDKVIEYYSR
jgi:small subunit ribosomal protein S4